MALPYQLSLSRFAVQMGEDVEQLFRQRLSRLIARETDTLQDLKQLHVDMTGLEALLDVRGGTEFQRKYGIPRGRIDQLEDDTWVDISRQHLLTLLRLEQRALRRNPNFRFMSVVPDPMWGTFGKPAVALVGKDLEGQTVLADDQLVTALKGAGLKIIGPRTRKVAKLLQTENCICIGSPKCNDYTTEVMSCLWPKGGNPIKFSWPDWPPSREQDSLSKEGPLGIEFIDHRDRHKSVLDKSPNRPAGVLIVCRCPPGAKKNVTTLVIAGATKFGTLQIVEDLICGNVYVSSSQLTKGRVSVLMLMPRDRGKRWYDIEAERELDRKHKQSS